MEPTDLALLLLRLWLGVVIIAHGVNHGRGLDGTAEWFAGMGWQNPRRQALLSAVGEIAIGAGLVVGLLTSVAAGGLIAVMFVAYLTVHRKNGFFIFRPGEGYEYVATIAVVGLSLAILGAGDASLDGLLEIDGLNGWTGLVIGLGGLVVARLQVAMFWRPTD